MTCSTSLEYRWSSCDITKQNLVALLLMPAKVICASAWANHSAVRSAQNGGSCMATLNARTSLSFPQSPFFVGVTNVGCRVR
jgi:hypothetical protein